MTTTHGATGRAKARRRWVMLGIVLIVQFMVILDRTNPSVN
jgi:hypothetical protein